MKQLVRSVACVVLATFASSSFAAAPPSGLPCERSNRALLLSSQHQAQADFWLHVAESLGEPSDRALRGIKAAYVDWRSADALALHVFTAREQACALFGQAPAGSGRCSGRRRLSWWE